ncbi:uncharacterized protein PHALS_07645 [Plasmopara halstedii]|uniref:B box-type domain-containing protein n=1 Tax=Plasmopara halstedii TaxID=4781 RepID=A0A0P1B541_PLAHL|nr:uncharacterized protein PHALS_07645 [Plasmopara halstedii]CEG49909.1 hypothetical protein PHALS_07645 [Plasmopara halstedii]|eukprot:XP_024586278.1 hypothetical protein PHALS_07645 [Plasmopara halstedii]
MDGNNGWSSILTNAVVQCSCKSERQLYMYGINSTRCPQCQTRLHSGINACIMCNYNRDALRKCRRCSQNDPVMWCAECDAFFCIHCYKKPHVLMLGSYIPHHCFAIDSASGKHLVEAAWSNEFLTMVRATYRLRLYGEVQVNDARSTVQHIAADARGGVCPTVLAAVVSSTTATSATPRNESKASETVSTVFATGAPKAGMSEHTRKRESPNIEDESELKLARTDPSLKSDGKCPASIMDSMILYERVKAMHDLRAAQANTPHARLPKPLKQSNVQDKLLVQSMRNRDSSQQWESHTPEEVTRVITHEEQERKREKDKVEQQQQIEERPHPIEDRGQEDYPRQKIKTLQQKNERQYGCRRQDISLWREQQHWRDADQDQQRHQRLNHEHEYMQELVSRRQVAAQSLGLDGRSYDPHSTLPRRPYSVDVLSHATGFQLLSSSTARDLSFQGTDDVFSITNTGPHTYATCKPASAQLSSFETGVQDHDNDNYHIVVRNLNAQQHYQPPGFSNQIVLQHRIAKTGEENFNCNKVCENDELRAIWVGDYDNFNALVMQLDNEIMQRTKEVHEFVHRSNNLAFPESLKLQIDRLRVRRDAAFSKRLESVARVLTTSEAVRSFAQQNEHADRWNDVPAVMHSSHKKCAELATNIRELERQAQKLREEIDKAVSCGNPSQMQNVAQLGAHIADLERKISIANGERDKQFIFMFQYSNTLRNVVLNERVASGSSNKLSADEE